MPTSNKDAREARKRIAQMQAKEALRREHKLRSKRDNVVSVVAIGAAVALAVVLQITVFSRNPTAAQTAAVEAGLESSASPSVGATSSSTAAPTSGTAPTNGANIPKASTAAGKTFTGTLTLNKQPIGVQINGTKAPQAAAVFKSLTDRNFFHGLSCHRLTNASDFGVLQCGSKDGKGGSDPTFEWGPVENTPADGKYPAGSIAVARGSSVYSNGTQFFFVYEDTVLPQTDGGYTIMGKVTSGLDVVQKIADGGITGGGTDGSPVTPVTIDSFTLK
ncbi:peptidylprolyl isomerase [Paenarthrobacter sp. Z7-10]|uniref:peptidylprolyl isomerase n=1 Tax=Paenarthrobacter sp. Z7-10 TaxID=2787635 RepID=UPI0022A8E377|nr:peptidylprolyl isomerase [Paenarthrobacter sp. Z7-10]MCZ2402744.1 peptidylprolyl isomerase [Paenarthrobacter sp. Z7-10]